MMGDTEKSTSWGTGIEHQLIGFAACALGLLPFSQEGVGFDGDSASTNKPVADWCQA